MCNYSILGIVYVYLTIKFNSTINIYVSKSNDVCFTRRCNCYWDLMLQINGLHRLFIYVAMGVHFWL